MTPSAHAAPTARPTARPTASTCVLRLRGDLDLDRALAIREQMEDALDAAATVVRLDLSEASFLDCAGLDALLWCLRRGRRAGVRVEMTQPSRAVTRLLSVTRTRRLFPVAA